MTRKASDKSKTRTKIAGAKDAGRRAAVESERAFPAEKQRDRLLRGLQWLVDRIASGVVWLLEVPLKKPLEGLAVQWSRLSPGRKTALYRGMWGMGVALGVYSAWFARQHSATAFILKWGWLRVEAQYGILLLAWLFFIPGCILMQARAERRGSRSPVSVKPPAFVYRWRDRIVAPLTQARLLYLLHQDTRALERTQAVLAQNPNDLAGRELRTLLETRITKQNEAEAVGAQQTSPRPTRRENLLDSDLPTLAAFSVVGLMLCLSAGLALYYLRVSIAQGWRVVVWTGHDKMGNPMQTYAWEALLGFLVTAGMCGLYLAYTDNGLANTTAWKRFAANRAAARKAVQNDPAERKT